MYFYQLNRILTKLVKFLAFDYRVKYRLLNLISTPYTYKIIEEIPIKTSILININISN